MSELFRTRTLAAAAFLSAGLVGLGLTVPAQAAPAASDLTTAVTCAAGQGSIAARHDGINREPALPAATVAAYESSLSHLLGTSAADSAARRSPSTTTLKQKVKVKVYVHVIKPHKSTGVVSSKRVRKQVKIMNRAYAGKQSRSAYHTKISFTLKKIDRTVNKSWFRADLGTKAAKKMKSTLHRGGRGDLNLYISAPKSSYGITLGYSTFPQQYKKHKSQDGVVINVDSMKGGRLTGYNRGDTAVHETGHWLGLYHTFQGGCSTRNDHVSDTPAEAQPNFECPGRLDTCTAPGLDPIHNFMDYSYDSCMNMFTKGQVERMKLHWRAYRD